MSEAKHTPGPWVATGGYTPTVTAGDVLIAVPGARADSLGGRTLAELGANAELIAAAPAFAAAWRLVPEDIRERIFDALYTPATGWVEKAIRAVAGGGPVA